MTKEEALHQLEVLDSQVGNGGLYQYYFNVIAPLGGTASIEPLEVVWRLVAAGSAAGFPKYSELLQILGDYKAFMMVHLALDFDYEDDEGIERAEDALYDECDILDDRYYAIKDVIVAQFEELAILATKPVEITITDPQSLPGRLTIVE